MITTVYLGLFWSHLGPQDGGHRHFNSSRSVILKTNNIPLLMVQAVSNMKITGNQASRTNGAFTYYMC